VALQLDVAPHEKPAFTSNEVTQSLKATANLVTKLSRKPKPKPKAIVNITNATDGNETNTVDADAESTEDADAGAESTEDADSTTSETEGEPAEKAEEDASADKDNDEL
jgi:hypothetical protein